MGDIIVNKVRDIFPDTSIVGCETGIAVFSFRLNNQERFFKVVCFKSLDGGSSAASAIECVDDMGTPKQGGDYVVCTRKHSSDIEDAIIANVASLYG